MAPFLEKKPKNMLLGTSNLEYYRNSSSMSMADAWEYETCIKSSMVQDPTIHHSSLSSHDWIQGHVDGEVKRWEQSLTPIVQYAK